MYIDNSFSNNQISNISRPFDKIEIDAESTPNNKYISFYENKEDKEPKIHSTSIANTPNQPPTKSNNDISYLNNKHRPNLRTSRNPSVIKSRVSSKDSNKNFISLNKAKLKL